MLCEDVIVIGSGAAEKMTWLDAYPPQAARTHWVHSPGRSWGKLLPAIRQSGRNAGL